MNDYFDTIIVGTGFASSYFLLEYLKHASLNERILVLEKGDRPPYSWKVENQTNSDVPFNSLIENETPEKSWIQNIGFGGGSCWTGNTPRMHPTDFQMKTLYGIGEDWPFDYEVLEPYISEVEQHMGIAGKSTQQYPQSQPYPMGPHKFNALDRLLYQKYGDLHIPMPSARASNFNYARPKCCNNGVCSVCPIGAKFQVDLYMQDIYDDDRVTLRLNSTVEQVVIENNIAKGVVVTEGGKSKEYKSDFVAVGAHAIMTPHILLRSGIEQEALGRYLSEQISIDVRVNLRGVDNYDGGQRVTGLNTLFLDHDNRSEVPGCLIENYNIPWLRAEFGKWRHVGLLKFVMEDIPSVENRVTLSAAGKPKISYAKHSPYMIKGINAVGSRVEQLLEGLPVEDYVVESKEGSLGGSAHIQGTTRIGNDPTNSVADSSLLNHKVRNLACLGSGAFPSCPAANPTLILSALSIKSARDIFS
jgi:choline dehydrogenase-like flavoprotein